MASGTTQKPKAVPDEEPETEPVEQRSPFDETHVETKAGTFNFRELDGESYDECVEAATTKHEDGRETTNMITLLRILADRSCIDKGVGIDQINKLPMKIRNKVLSAVNTMYFPDELEEFARQLRLAGWTVTAPPKDETGNA